MKLRWSKELPWEPGLYFSRIIQAPAKVAGWFVTQADIRRGWQKNLEWCGPIHVAEPEPQHPLLAGFVEVKRYLENSPHIHVFQRLESLAEHYVAELTAAKAREAELSGMLRECAARLEGDRPSHGISHDLAAKAKKMLGGV